MASLNLLTATAADLQTALTAGNVNSVDLVNRYLAQIHKHNDYLKAVLQTVPIDTLLAQAETLDQERAKNAVRGPLHGIPILIKDNIATHPDLLLKTTAGNFTLAESRPRRNAYVVDKLIEAGVIILGKASLSELNYFKGTGLPCGWSAIGGQTQSPYIRGGYKDDGSPGGHTNCGGSSSGSGVAVAAGFVPFSIGAEAEGSLTMPATRAALYTVKPTPGIVPGDGVIPFFPPAESLGPMAKCVRDIALLLDVLVDPSKTTIPEGGYESAITGSFAGLRIAAASPLEWYFDATFVKPIAEATSQMNKETLAAYEKIRPLAKAFHDNVSLPPLEELDYNGSNALTKMFIHNFKENFESYLADLEYSPVRTLQEFIEYNRDNAEKELPAGYESQDMLTKALTYHLPPKEYEETFAHMRKWSRDKGVDYILQKYNADVIIGPADSELTQFSAASGYPLATLPLSYLDLNGRPFGLVALAGAHQEAKLVELQSAWEATFPSRRPPTYLDGGLAGDEKA